MSNRSASEVSADGTLQLLAGLAGQLAKVLQVVASGNTESTNEVLGGALEVTVLLLRLILGAAKVCVGRDGGCPLETL